MSWVGGAGARAWLWGVMGSACVAAAWCAGATAATTPASINTFTATPATLPAGGGRIALAASVANASTCTFSTGATVAGLPVTVDCAAGSGSTQVSLPPNAGSSTKSYTFKLVAHGKSSHAVATVKVTVAPTSRPVVTSFLATPGALPAAGGTVGLSATIGNASKCTFSSSPVLTGLPETTDCSTGTAGTVVVVPANKASRDKSYRFKITAKGGGRSARATSVVTVAAKGTPPGIVHVTGTLVAGATWSPQGASVYVVHDVTIPAGVTLALAPGTLVKVDGQVAFQLAGGTLQVGGTSASPVVVTSVRDDTVGGDTNGDGPSSGAGGDFEQFANLPAGGAGQISIVHAQLRFATQPVACDGPGSFSLLDSTLQGGVELSGPCASSAVLRRNAFTVSGGPAIVATGLDGAGLALSGADANSFAGSAVGRTIVLDGALVAAGATWEISPGAGAVVVVNENAILVRGTLILDAGLLVKLESFAAVDVEDSGSLYVNGTAAARVVFTSIRDDAVGGDSGGDGPTSGGGYPYAIQDNAGPAGSVTVTHAWIERAFWSVATCGEGSLSFTDNGTDSPLWFREPPCRQPSAVDVRRNTFTITSSVAAIAGALADPTGIILSGPDANTFNGTGRGNTIDLPSAAVPAGKTWTLSSTTGAVPVFEKPLVVEGTLTLDPGAVVKLHDQSGFDLQGGSLVSAGTAARPVVITSLHDDSVGGDSDNNGPSAGGTTDYIWAVRADSAATAQVTIAHTQIRFGLSSVDMCSPGSVSISDSTLASSVYIGGTSCGSPTADLRRNTFTVTTGEPAIEGSPTDLSGIVLSGPDANTFNGGGAGNTLRVDDGIVPAGKTWEVSPATGAVLVVHIPMTVNGTLVLDAGAVVKVASDGWRIGIGVQGGTVTAAGTSSSPVVITSLSDDSAGGDSNHDGPSAGAANAYAEGIELDGPSSVLNATFLDIRYATVPIQHVP